MATDDAHYYPGKAPAGLMLHPDGSKLYVGTNGGVAVISTANMEIIDILEFEYYAYDAVLDHNGEYIYFVYNPPPDSGVGKLAKMDTTDGSTEALDLSPANVYQVVIDDEGEYLYVSGVTWPAFGEHLNPDGYWMHDGTGMIIEINLEDFEVSRTAYLSAGLESGLCYQNGKLVVMSPWIRHRQLQGTGKWDDATTCHIIDVSTLTIQYTIAVPAGLRNHSFPLGDGIHVMAGFNSDVGDGVGFGLINVQIGDVEHWYVTDPNPDWPNMTPEGGGDMMAIDTVNDILYATLYATKPHGQTQARLGIIDLNTNTYSDWYLNPYRLYGDIVYNPILHKIYVSAPFDDAIVVLEAPE